MSRASEFSSPSPSGLSGKNVVKRAVPSASTPPIFLDASSPSPFAPVSSASETSAAPLYTTDKVIEELKLLSQRMLEATKEARDRVKLTEETDMDEGYISGSSTSNNIYSINSNGDDTDFDQILGKCMNNPGKDSEAAPISYEFGVGIGGMSTPQELQASSQTASSSAVNRCPDAQNQSRYGEVEKERGRKEGVAEDLPSSKTTTTTTNARGSWKAIIPIGNEWREKAGVGERGRGGVHSEDDIPATGSGRAHPGGESKSNAGGAGSTGVGRARGGVKGGNSLLHHDPQFLLNMEGSGFLGIPIPSMLSSTGAASVPSAAALTVQSGGGTGKKKKPSILPTVANTSSSTSLGQKGEVNEADDETTSPILLDEIFGAETEESTTDTVTITCFKVKDPRLYQCVKTSVWVPEPIARYEDGSFAGRWDPSKNDESTAEMGESEMSSGTSHTVPLSNGTAGNTMALKRRGEAERGAVGKGSPGSTSLDAHSGGNAESTPLTDRSSHRPSVQAITKTYRVPFFPFGGGVTAAQVRELMASYSRCGKRISSRKAAKPFFVRESAFWKGDYPEVGDEDQKHASGGFHPESLYDFVVEVERWVQFDPLKARLERQKEFLRLVQEKKAPMAFGSFNLKVIMNPIRTGFEEERDFPISRGVVIANRYRVVRMIAKSTFGRTARCEDLLQPIYDEEEQEEENIEGKDSHAKSGLQSRKDEEKVTGDGTRASTLPTAEMQKSKSSSHIIGYKEVCLKIIHNTKDFFDQSLDEIRLLRLLNEHKDADEAHVLRLIDAFYYKEHCMLVTELLSENLYEYSTYNRTVEDGAYFTLSRLQRISRQVMEALAYVHSLNLIHADLKPENILFASRQKCIVKVIDFGSSSFLSDHLSSYIQSRHYRAPEVILGCDYDGRIDVWSYGAILMELVTGKMLFQSTSVPEMLARMVLVCGKPLPRRMLWEGRYTHHFISKFGAIYAVVNSGKEKKGGKEEGDIDHKVNSHNGTVSSDDDEVYYVYTPRQAKCIPRTCATAVPSGSKKKVDLSKQTSKKGQEEFLSEKSYDFIHHHEDGSFVPLRKELVEAGITDSVFADFVEQCLNLNHKKRWTSKELLQHPFIRDVTL